MSQVTPVFDQPAELHCPVGPLWAWYTLPAGALVQMMEACVFSREMAEWLVGPAHDQFIEHFAQQTPLRLLLDLRPMTAREPAVRAHGHAQSSGRAVERLWTRGARERITRRSAQGAASATGSGALIAI